MPLSRDRSHPEADLFPAGEMVPPAPGVLEFMQRGFQPGAKVRYRSGFAHLYRPEIVWTVVDFYQPDPHRPVVMNIQGIDRGVACYESLTLPQLERIELSS